MRRGPAQPGLGFPLPLLALHDGVGKDHAALLEYLANGSNDNVHSDAGRSPRSTALHRSWRDRTEVCRERSRELCATAVYRRRSIGQAVDYESGGAVEQAHGELRTWSPADLSRKQLSPQGSSTSSFIRSFFTVGGVVSGMGVGSTSKR